jgi:dihydrofolate reductase
MRKLKLQMQISLDGYNAAGPSDEQKWVTWDLDGIRAHVVGLLDSADTILIGRKLAVDYIPFWLRTVENKDDPMHDFATRIVAARKIVFTKTLTESPWPNTQLATGDLKEEVLKLKAQTGKDILVYGGSSFVAALIRAGLVDELHFFVNPIALGKGASAFSQLETWQPLALKNAVPLASGLVLLHYERG